MPMWIHAAVYLASAIAFDLLTGWATVRANEQVNAEDGSDPVSSNALRFWMAALWPLVMVLILFYSMSEERPKK